MSQIKRAVPSPAMLVAVVALVAALGGSAVAEVASTSKLSKNDKNQVKRIAKKQGKKQANKQIEKKAPGLSVASAVEADKLDGKDAADLQTSSGYAERTDVLELTSDPQEVLSTSVPTTGTRIVANASVELDDGDSGTEFEGECEIRIAGVASPRYQQTIPVSAAERTTLAFTFAHVVSPGTHAVTLNCEEDDGDGDVDVEKAGLSAVAVGE